MSIKIRLKNFVWILANWFILLSLVWIKEILSNLEKGSQIRLIAIIGSILLIISLSMIKSVRNSFDCYCILLGLQYVFMLGQHILFLLNIHPQDMIILTNRVSKQAMYDTGFLFFYSILSVNIGYLMSSFAKISDNLLGYHKINYSEEKRSEEKRRILYDTGCSFLRIAIIPTIITLATNIYLTFTFGYGERMLNTLYRKSGITNIAGILSGLMIPSLLAVFIGRKKGQRWPIAAIAIYMLLYALSASRVHIMTLFLGLVFIQNKFFERLSLKKGIKYGILIVAVVCVFPVISATRGNIAGKGDIKAVLRDGIASVREKSIFVSVMSEAGYTFEATAAVVDHCPDDIDYNYGISYLSGVIYILPNGLTNNYYNVVRSTDEIFQGYINSNGSGIGSSYVAEAYWNFGYLSLVIFFIFGLLLGKLSVAFDKAVFNGNYISIFVCTYIFSCISFYVRSDTRTFYRNFVWFCLPFIIMYKSKISRALMTKK